MSSAALFANVVAYSLQLGLVLAVGLSLPGLLCFKNPVARLRYWYLLLSTSLLLPTLPWPRLPHGGPEGGATSYLAGTFTLVVTPGSRALSPWSWALGLLAAVAATRLLWLGVGLLRLAALRRAAAPLASPPPVMRAVMLKVGLEVSFHVSDRVATPLTFGWLKPTILLPRTVLDLPGEAQRCIALHELIHVKRRHWLATLAEEVLRSLLWFHPAVWLVLDRITLAREQAVDLQVVRLIEARRTYMETLAAMARRRHDAAAVAFLPFFHRSHLLQRLALLTQEVSMSRKRLGLTVAALTGALLVTAALAAGAFPLLRGVPQELPQNITEGTAPDDPSVYEMGHPGIQPPKLLEQVNPVYPNEAKEKGIHGRVVLSVIIDEKGEVIRPKVLKSVDPMLSVAAIEAVSRWRFETPMLDGQAVRVRWVITINFTLNS